MRDGDGGLWDGSAVSGLVQACLGVITGVLTFSGTYSPQITDPPLGVRRGRPDGTGGYILRPSSMQALR